MHPSCGMGAPDRPYQNRGGVAYSEVSFRSTLFSSYSCVHAPAAAQNNTTRQGAHQHITNNIIHIIFCMPSLRTSAYGRTKIHPHLPTVPIGRTYAATTPRRVRTAMATGKALVQTGHGGPEVLQLQPAFSVPAPGPGEILIKLVATSVNPVDVLVRLQASLCENTFCMSMTRGPSQLRIGKHPASATTFPKARKRTAARRHNPRLHPSPGQAAAPLQR